MPGGRCQVVGAPGRDLAGWTGSRPVARPRRRQRARGGLTGTPVMTLGRSGAGPARSNGGAFGARRRIRGPSARGQRKCRRGQYGNSSSVLSGDLRPIVSQTGTDREPPESARALHANSGMGRHVVVLGATGSMTANTERVIGALRVVTGPGYPRRGAHCRQEPRSGAGGRASRSSPARRHGGQGGCNAMPGRALRRARCPGSPSRPCLATLEIAAQLPPRHCGAAVAGGQWQLRESTG